MTPPPTPTRAHYAIEPRPKPRLPSGRAGLSAWHRQIRAEIIAGINAPEGSDTWKMFAAPRVFLLTRHGLTWRQLGVWFFNWDDIERERYVPKLIGRIAQKHVGGTLLGSVLVMTADIHDGPSRESPIVSGEDARVPYVLVSETDRTYAVEVLRQIKAGRYATYPLNDATTTVDAGFLIPKVLS